MTHYHLNIECGAIIDANSHFYRVAIGQSGPEQRVFHILQAYAAQHGHFFDIASREHEEFFYQCLNSLEHSSSPAQQAPDEPYSQPRLPHFFPNCGQSLISPAYGLT